MKLLPFREFENEKPAIELEEGKRIDVSAFVEDYNEQFFKNDGLSKKQRAENYSKSGKMNLRSCLS